MTKAYMLGLWDFHGNVYYEEAAIISEFFAENICQILNSIFYEFFEISLYSKNPSQQKVLALLTEFSEYARHKTNIKDGSIPKQNIEIYKKDAKQVVPFPTVNKNKIK